MPKALGKTGHVKPGDLFDKWEVESAAPHRKTSRAWNVKCECGHRQELAEYDLVGGGSTGCRSCSSIKDDLTGKTMGRWYVEAFVTRSGKPWKCRCLGCGLERFKGRTELDRNDRTGSCRRCMINAGAWRRKRPYEALYNTFVALSKHKGVGNELSYDQFLVFTAQKECHYCEDPIEWTEYGIGKAEGRHGRYFLDRKNHNKPYEVLNVVVSCSHCNYKRGNEHCDSFRHRGYTYEEWYGMTAFQRNRKALARTMGAASAA